MSQQEKCTVQLKISKIALWYLGVLVDHIGDLALLADLQQTYSEVGEENLLHFMYILDSEAQNRI